VYALWALARGRGRTPALLHGGALMGALVTGVIYHLLRGTFGGFAILARDWLGDQLVHTAVPLLMLLDWLFFAPKGRFRPMYPIGWALFPLTYLALTVAAARMGLCFPNSNTPYPYPFLDVWSLGLGPVVRNTTLITLAFLALGGGIAVLDRRWGKKTDVVSK
ncbi:MAG: Pr6Pr family membrane protein, partial [Lawsonibacter sp.]